jgi:hypothetical protein
MTYIADSKFKSGTTHLHNSPYIIMTNFPRNRHNVKSIIIVMVMLPALSFMDNIEHASN